MTGTSKTKLSVIALGLGVAAIALPFGAYAADTAMGTLTVTATVLSSCMVNSPILAFGNYDPSTTAATTGSSVITVTCTGASTGTVGLGAGSGSGATTSARAMTETGGGTATLDYTLFQPSVAGSGATATTTNWGDTIGSGGDTVAFTTTTSALSQDLTVFGSIPAGQTPPAGSYQDTVAITVSY